MVPEISGNGQRPAGCSGVWNEQEWKIIEGGLEKIYVGDSIIVDTKRCRSLNLMSKCIRKYPSQKLANYAFSACQLALSLAT